MCNPRCWDSRVFRGSDVRSDGASGVKDRAFPESYFALSLPCTPPSDCVHNTTSGEWHARFRPDNRPTQETTSVLAPETRIPEKTPGAHGATAVSGERPDESRRPLGGNSVGGFVGGDRDVFEFQEAGAVRQTHRWHALSTPSPTTRWMDIRCFMKFQR